jgi:phage gp36-like protein
MYITSKDFDNSLYPEIKQAIARHTELYVNHQINIALAIIESRLGVKYDILAEFAKNGTNRNALILDIALDIAIYKLYNSQEIVPEHRIKRYEDAIEFLKDLVKGTAQISIPLLPANANSTHSGNVTLGSNKKRVNRIR